MSAHEPPIERLNYFNGQRLEATDFRAEQDYHVRVRRWLNRSLYFAGIASGLEVTKHPTDKHRVVVSAGLAIDAAGREIILLEPQEVLARGVPTGKNGIVFGNYLVISYAESKVAALQDGCRVDASAALGKKGSCGCKGGAGGCGCGAGAAAPAKGGCGCGGGCGGKRSASCGCGGGGQGGCACGGKNAAGAADTGLAWGGMTRIRAEPVLEFQNTWPTKASGKIVLAQLDLNAQCQVVNILSGMRQYTSQSNPPKVRGVSLEGEKDIDHDNPKVLYFQVAGGMPDRVTLHLWTRRLSTLYYTELGRHTHKITGKAIDVTKDLTHAHTVSGGETDPGGDHTHNYFVDGGETTGGIDVNDVQVVGRFNTDGSAIVPAPAHTHKLSNLKLNNSLAPWTHDHVLDATASNVGSTTLSARDGQPAYAFIDDLKIELDGADVTAEITTFLNDASPGDWLKLGDGTGSHHLASDGGTGPIELKSLGFDFAVGQHRLVFSVPAGKGGQLHYNLYVE